MYSYLKKVKYNGACYKGVIFFRETYQCFTSPATDWFRNQFNEKTALIIEREASIIDKLLKSNIHDLQSKHISNAIAFIMCCNI